MSVFGKLYTALNEHIRIKINKKYKNRLINNDFSVLSTNCNAACMLHDVDQPFNSPFVNLWVTLSDFCKYVNNIEYYNDLEVIKLEEESIKEGYPVGILGDIVLHFTHYKSFDEAKEKWHLRKKRINLKKLFLMASDRDGATYEDIVAFDNLPYENKVIFTHNKMPEIKSSYYISGFEHEKEVGVLSKYSGINGKKYYDQFDWISFFNDKGMMDENTSN